LLTAFDGVMKVLSHEVFLVRDGNRK
jgi:hypothetical protein